MFMVVAVVTSTLGGACGTDFLPASIIANERVIAVTADPPEAVPGQAVTLTPLVVSPSGEVVEGASGYRATWWRCPDGDGDALGDFAQCSDPSERVELSASVPFVDSVPLDLFGDLQAAAASGSLPSDKMLGAILGYWRVVSVTVRAGDRSVEALKRVPVFLPVALADVDPQLAELDVHVRADGTTVPPNTNPTLSGVALHEGSATGATVSAVKRDGEYFLEPIYDERTLEDYISLKVDFAGLDLSDPEALRDVPLEDLLERFEKVQRCEIPTFSWFVTHGSVRRDTTIDEGVVQRVFDARGVDCPDVEGEERVAPVRYQPPVDDEPVPADGVVRGWVVLRDGRGGTATRAFSFRFE
ncbi:MAG: hypothetical protein A2138_10750 [Deltaproteobacteria bacterium RBG_16_71_12]|nr:MAG: hypothetical protein A2138_10750 [Deltaproteobacteria bacterium RBG_16_71_12]